MYMNDTQNMEKFVADALIDGHELLSNNCNSDPILDRARGQV